MTLARALRGAWARVHAEQRLIVLLKDLDDVPATPREVDGLRLEVVERRHLPALVELNRERALRSADRRFAEDTDAGYGGYVAFKAERPIGFYWWVDRDAPTPSSKGSVGGAISELGLGIDMEHGDVYGADLYVREADRGGGIAQRVLDLVEGDLRRRGYRRLWGYVQEANRPARWTYSLRRYRPMWVVVRTTTLARRRTRIEPVSKER